MRGTHRDRTVTCGAIPWIRGRRAVPYSGERFPETRFPCLPGKNSTRRGRAGKGGEGGCAGAKARSFPRPGGTTRGSGPRLRLLPSAPLRPAAVVVRARGRAAAGRLRGRTSGRPGGIKRIRGGPPVGVPVRLPPRPVRGTAVAPAGAHPAAARRVGGKDPGPSPAFTPIGTPASGGRSPRGDPAVGLGGTGPRPLGPHLGERTDAGTTLSDRGEGGVDGREGTAAHPVCGVQRGPRRVRTGADHGTPRRFGAAGRRAAAVLVEGGTTR